MKDYQNVLCATDFSLYCEAAAKRAVELARHYDADLTLLHVVENFPVYMSSEFIAPENIDPEGYREQRARKSLDEVARELGYAKLTQVVKTSSRAAKHAIVRYAKEHEIDLIVVATHGRHGITSILGSTSYGVTHTAPCDVLVISAHVAC